MHNFKYMKATGFSVILLSCLLPSLNKIVHSFIHALLAMHFNLGIQFGFDMFFYEIHPSGMS